MRWQLPSDLGRKASIDSWVPEDRADTTLALVYLTLGFCRRETKVCVDEMGQPVKAPAPKPGHPESISGTKCHELFSDPHIHLL